MCIEREKKKKVCSFLAEATSCSSALAGERDEEANQSLIYTVAHSEKFLLLLSPPPPPPSSHYLILGHIGRGAKKVPSPRVFGVDFY